MYSKYQSTIVNYRTASKTLIYLPLNPFLPILVSLPILFFSSSPPIFSFSPSLSFSSHLSFSSPPSQSFSAHLPSIFIGGSDVGSGCETLALRQSDGSFRLHGYKWFSSATDSNMAMTLARIVDEVGDAEAGSRGLSMFYLEVNDNEGGKIGELGCFPTHCLISFLPHLFPTYSSPPSCLASSSPCLFIPLPLHLFASPSLCLSFSSRHLFLSLSRSKQHGSGSS